MKKYYALLLLLVLGLLASAHGSEDGSACSIKGCLSHASVAVDQNASLGEELGIFWDNLFSTSLWPARWYCGTWTEFHGWLYILSDIGISTAYFAIPFVLGLFLFKRRRTGLPYPGIFLLFMLFIFSCGLTHLIDAAIFWMPVYNLSALIRFITAAVSIGTVFALAKVIPTAIKFKSPEELEKIIKQRTEELEKANAQLEHVNAQLALQIQEKERAREEVNTILESVPQITWTTTPQGKLSYVNKQWWKYSGLKEEDAGNWGKMLHPEDMEKIRKKWVESISSNTQFEAEGRLISAEGNYRWFLMKSVPVKDENDQTLKWIGTFTDINDRKIYEQRQDTFLNIASHELRTPLTVVRAYSELIAQHDVTKNNDDLKMYSDRVKNHIKKLESLIMELLDVSRVANGKMHYDMQRERFDEIIEDCVTDFRNINSTAHQVNLTGKTGAIVLCDREKISQVVYNLLTNSSKYSSPDNPIDIRITKVHDQVRCVIRDYGQGIPPEELQDIFKRFFRSSNNKIAGGLGLGLYISEEIIKAHNGNIEAASGSGNGTEFIFVLPVAEAVDQ